MAKKRRKSRKKKKKLNIKIAIVGLIVLMGLLAGAVIVLRGRKGDPLELIGQAETTLTEIEEQITEYRKILVAPNGETDNKKQLRLEEAELMLEAGKTSYKDSARFFGKAIGATDDDQLKIDIYFKLADFYAIDDEFQESDWQKIFGCWNAVLNIDPKNIRAMKAQLDNSYQRADYGDNRAWTTVEMNASSLLEVMEERLMDPDPSVLEAKGRALLKMATLGQVTNLQKTLRDAERTLEKLRELTPDNPEVYEYLAQAAETRGQIEASSGSRAAAKKAIAAAQGFREKALEMSNDNPKAHINLLNMQLRQAGDDKEKKRIMESDYKSLVARFPLNPEVYSALSYFYQKSDINKLDKAADSIAQAIELDREHVGYAMAASYLNYLRYSFFGDEDSLGKALQIANNALSLPNSQLVKGPRYVINRINRFTLYSNLSTWYVEQAIKAQQAENEQQRQDWIAKAEETIHQIGQILGTSDDVHAIKWRGMLAYAKGDRAETIRQLYDVYNQLKATKSDDALVSYTLAKLFEGSKTLGARIEFLQNAIKAKPSIIADKPEALLEYAKVLLALRAYSRAVPLVNVYENIFPANDRSRRIRLGAYLNMNMLDEAEEILAEEHLDEGDIIAFRISLVNRRISQIKRDMNQQESGQEAGSDARDPLALKDELSAYKKERIELVEKQLEVKPELLMLSTVRNICNTDYVNDGKIEEARDLMSRFLAHSPDNVNAKAYKLLLMEPDPVNVSTERRTEIKEMVLKDIPDQIPRSVSLAMHYQGSGQIDEAIAILKKARSSSPSNKQISEMLFNSALAKDDQDLAAELVQAARSENLDDCNGDYFAARLDIANKEHELAIEKLNRCLDTHPIFPYALFLKSKVNAILKNYDEAIDNAKIASTMNPLEPAMARQYAWLLYDRSLRPNTTLSDEDLKETKRALARAYTLAPDNPKLVRAYANFTRNRDPEEALSFLQRVQKKQSDVNYSLLLGSFAMKEFKKAGSEQRKAELLAIADSAYQTAIKIEPDNTKVLNAYSEFLRLTGKKEQAEAMFAGNDESLWRYHYRDGQYAKAKEILQELYDNNPEDVATIRGLTLTAQKTQDIDGLKNYSEQLLKLDPSADNELLQIQLYLEAGLTKEADLKLAGFRERNPEETKAMLMEAWANMSTGNLQKSLGLINRNLEIDPDNALAWRLRGQANSLLGDFSQAEKDTQKSLSISDDLVTHIALARIYVRADKKTEAMDELNSLLRDGQAPPIAYAMLEQLYRQAGNKTHLKALYSKAIKQFPENGQWYLQAGRFYSVEQDYDQAEKLSEKAWQLSQKTGGNAGALNQYLQTMWFNGKYENLLNYASQYTETPFAAIAYAQMAQAEIKLKNTPAAIEHYRKAIDKSAGNPSMQMGILRSMSANIGSEEVEKYCGQKLQVDPDSVIANLTMSNLFQQNGRYDKALEHLDRLLQTAEPDSPAWLTFTNIRAGILVSACTGASNEQYLEQAIEACEAILAKKPDNANILNNLAYLLADNDKKLDKAKEYAKRASQILSDNPHVMDTYAYTLCKTGDFEDAEKLLQTAIQLLERNSMDITWDLYKHLGMAQEGIGDKSKAALSYRKASKIAGDMITKKDKKALTIAINRVSL